MKQQSKSLSVGVHLFLTIGHWMIYYVIFFLVAMLGAYVILPLFDLQWGPLSEEYQISITQAFMNSAHIFFFVCGTLSMGGLIKYYLSAGITRKDYYYGLIISIGALSILLTGSAFVLQLLENVVFSVEITQPFTILVTVQLISKMFFYFLLGWFITTAFQKNVWRGFGSIIVSGAMIMLFSAIWGEPINLPIIDSIQFSLSYLLAISGTVILILILLSILNYLSKYFVVKA
ncbi:hypothetical protein [Alkalihalobacillus trypoxylicola]|uniref:Uncharacterized protein n=1 Tax=Alkalihalobacillus trypoxylicola TaxID=519424 RepID=A0A161PC07_9BACI|nr:hypothetical protein [Alkalihalobacillus trypoxylicola]KYG29369.1 hypothetical protein AZF04_07540 [Alkalihalobacillus trypoxylicola]